MVVLKCSRVTPFTGRRSCQSNLDGASLRLYSTQKRGGNYDGDNGDSVGDGDESDGNCKGR